MLLHIISGIFILNMTIANLLQSVTVKEFWKSVNIWWSWRQEYSVLVFLTQSVVCAREYILSRLK